jgi:hypothetical protein
MTATIIAVLTYLFLAPQEPYPDFFYPGDPSHLPMACTDYRKHVMDGGMEWSYFAGRREASLETLEGFSWTGYGWETIHYQAWTVVDRRNNLWVCWWKAPGFDDIDEELLFVDLSLP